MILLDDDDGLATRPKRVDDENHLRQIWFSFGIANASAILIISYARSVAVLAAARAFFFASSINVDKLEAEVDKSNEPSSQVAAISTTPGTIFQNGDGFSRKSDSVSLVFDVSDLISYFQHARLPTGIQRVQIEIIVNSIKSHSDENDFDLKVACFTKTSDTWLDLPVLFFNHICSLALVSGDIAAAEWKQVLEELETRLSSAFSLVFVRGAYLINLGTSWWLHNYFLHVRNAKARYGIRYIPFVHDCIPIFTPEHCTEQLTCDFISWVLGAFQHADHVLVNSCATQIDVCRTASFLGHRIEKPVVIKLDADYRAASLDLRSGNDFSDEIFLENGLEIGKYVLFVSTVESRKNHVFAFSAWLTLIKKFGLRIVPKLVCVGNRGWLNDAVYGKLNASKLLQSKIVMLSHISDPDLVRLYENCVFTLYPSSYEGWGLPVTESLCFGKVPVLARTSSLPEAGEDFAEYFELGEESSLVEILEQLLFDDLYREKKEADIRLRFRPRSWTEIAAQVVDAVKSWNQEVSQNPLRAGFSETSLIPIRAQLGRYYGITENLETSLYSGMSSGEVYRHSDGWWWPEPWGCWTKAKAARLSFKVIVPEGEAILIFLGLRGVQTERSIVKYSVESVIQQELVAEAGRDYWRTLCLVAQEVDQLRSDDGYVKIELVVSADHVADFRTVTGGMDHRVASVGVRGFMACCASDVDARLTFMECVTLDDMCRLYQRPKSDAGVLSGSLILSAAS